jgi:hypothetical protein
MKLCFSRLVSGPTNSVRRLSEILRTACRFYRHVHLSEWLHNVRTAGERPSSHSGTCNSSSISLSVAVTKRGRFLTIQSYRPLPPFQTWTDQPSCQTPWSESASELHLPSDRRLLAKLASTFADRGCRVVSVMDPHSRILGFLDRSCYFFFQVAPQLY